MAKRVRRGAALSRKQPQDLTGYAPFIAAMNEAISENLCGFCSIEQESGIRPAAEAAVAALYAAAAYLYRVQKPEAIALVIDEARCLNGDDIGKTATHIAPDGLQ
jgi:hypothetical protein